MVLCILALPLFSILGIFSVKFRRLAADALKCLVNTATLKKCESGLDERIKASITGKLLKRSPTAAKIVYRNYKLLSLLFLAAMLWSTYSSAVSFYNLAKYGNCNKPEETGFCLLDPTGSQTSISEAGTYSTNITYPQVTQDDPIIGGSANLTIIEFGCYACPYTKKAEPILREILKKYKGKVNVQFRTFLIPRHNMSYEAALAANCAQEQGRYEQYHNALFAAENLTTQKLYELAQGMDEAQFKNCMQTGKYREEILEDSHAGTMAGVKGTPTFFIKQQRVVGPKPIKTFQAIIDSEQT